MQLLGGSELICLPQEGCDSKKPVNCRRKNSGALGCMRVLARRHPAVRRGKETWEVDYGNSHVTASVDGRLDR